MKNRINNICRLLVVALFFAMNLVLLNDRTAMAADYSLTMAPMYQKIMIDPGDTYTTSFKISNGASSVRDTYYEIRAVPFTVDDNNRIKYDEEIGESSEIVRWVSFNVPTEGKLAPNEVKEVSFTINVPDDVPNGGQYFSVQVTSSDKPSDEKDKDESQESVMIKEVNAMSHLVYTEITGHSLKSGELLDPNVPSFILSGNVTGMARAKNTGNVHMEAKYTLQVFPFFSNEEIYTNEEDPVSSTVMPGRELFSEIVWENTPEIGIFRVVFKGELGDNNFEIEKMVIKCPVWLLFIIFFVIAAVIIYFVARARKRSGRTDS